MKSLPSLLGLWNKRVDFEFKGDDTVDGRCLQQWLANILGRIEETPRDLQMGPDNVSRTWIVTGYPEGAAYLGQLDDLLNFHVSETDHKSELKKIHVRVTYILVPAVLPENLATGWLRNRQEGKATESALQGLPDADSTQGLKAYSDLHQAVHFDKDATFRYWIAVTLSAPNRRLLDRAEQKLHQTVTLLGMKVTLLYKEQIEGMSLSHVLGQRQTDLMKSWPGRFTYTRPLSYLFPFRHGSLSDGQGCYVGHEIDQLSYRRATYVDFKRGTGPMALVVCGMSGEGKSTFIKGLNNGLLLEDFIIFQYDANNEYKDITDLIGGQHVDLTVSSGRYFEPLVIPQAVGDAQYDAERLSRTNELFHCVLRGLAEEITAEERALADKLLTLTWKAAGVDSDRPATWNRSTSIHDWYQFLRHYVDDRTRQTPAETLQAKLYPYFEGTLQLFKQAVEPAWSDVPFVRIAVSNYVSNKATDERLAGVKMMLVTHRVWDAVVANKLKGERFLTVNIDEGQRVLRDPVMAQHVYQLGTDGRKFNAGVSVAANDVNVFFETTGGRGLWENASMRCMFFMEDSGLKKAVENSAIPDPVIEQVKQLKDSYFYMISRKGGRWTKAKMELPDDEVKHYATRGLKEGGSA